MKPVCRSFATESNITSWLHKCSLNSTRKSECLLCFFLARVVFHFMVKLKLFTFRILSFNDVIQLLTLSRNIGFFWFVTAQVPTPPQLSSLAHIPLIWTDALFTEFWMKNQSYFFCIYSSLWTSSVEQLNCISLCHNRCCSISRCSEFDFWRLELLFNQWLWGVWCKCAVKMLNVGNK